MIAAFLQFGPVFGEVEANLEAVSSHLDGADADLVVLPELFATGYFFRTRDELAALAETVPDGPTTARLVEWSAGTGSTIVAGLPERDGDRFFNSAVVVTPDGYAGTYRKVHRFYEETQVFERGDLGFPVFDVADRWGGAYRLGVMICYDWRFPEAARTLALAGADVVAHPANLVRPNCPRTMPIRALENHVYTVTANRTGEETAGGETLAFIGQSLICDPDGRVLASAGRDETLLGRAPVDPAAARERRINRHNELFADRVPEAYRLG